MEGNNNKSTSSFSAATVPAGTGDKRDMATTATTIGVKTPPITVIGAGVLGLSTALTLQRRHPRTSITIIAAEVPSLPSTWLTRSSSSPSSPSSDTNTSSSSSASTSRTTTDGPDNKTSRPSADYASMWAGAHYRPIPRSSRQLEQEFDLAVRTNQIMKEIMRKHPVSETGLDVMPARELLESPPEHISLLKTGNVYAGEGDDFRVLTHEELNALPGARLSGEEDGEDRIGWGCEYTSWCVNVHVYMRWLMDQFVKNGGTLTVKTLDSIDTAFDVGSDNVEGRETSIVVNCSGRNFDSDPQMEIIRGQTVLVKNQYHSTVTRQNRDGSWAFLIPRPGAGGTVIGGTKEVGDLETESRADSRKILLENAVKYFPDFVDDIGKFEVLMDNVGRRPWREGGLRIEVEELSSKHNRKKVVVHGYGAGGRGYEISWGVAERLADMVDGLLQ